MHMTFVLANGMTGFEKYSEVVNKALLRFLHLSLKGDQSTSQFVSFSSHDKFVSYRNLEIPKG